jgi:hypothetical protein
MVGMNTGKILTFAGQLDGFWRSVWGRGWRGGVAELARLFL